METRIRAGRMSDDNFINALNRRYALLRGRYETIEQECESAIGVAALIEAQDRVENEKVLMRRVMDAIEIVGRDVDLDWSPGRIKPIYRKMRDSSTGRIARTARNILRKAGRPMRVHEIARGVANALGLEPDERLIARFDVAIRNSFERRIGKEIGLIQGPPLQYYIRAASSWAGGGRGRPSSGAASSLSNRETPAISPPS